MKEQYTAPEMEIIRFDCEDVITTSGGKWELPVIPGIAPDSEEW